MMTDRMIERVGEAVQYEAGKSNRVLDVRGDCSGFVIRLHKATDQDDADVYYTGRKDKPHGYMPGNVMFFDTKAEAYSGLLADKVQPYSDDEMPQIVFAGVLFVITENEVRT